jgi:hypothetical protein
MATIADHASPGLSAWQARWLLLGAALLAIAGVAVTFSPARSGYAEKPRSDKPGDVALYNAEIQRMRAGEGYYAVAASELRARGYPTASLFNWRTPLPMWLVAKLPEPAAKVILGALAVLLIGCGARLMTRGGETPTRITSETLARRASEGDRKQVLPSPRPSPQGGEGVVASASRQSLAEAALCGILLFGAVMPVFLADLYAMPVLWSGVLIGLSVCAYGHGRWGWGVMAGIAALFCRDLAAPYCLASAVWALWRRRWGEVLAWLIALGAYAVFFLVHVQIVRGYMQPGDMAHDHSWLRLGGLPFVVSLVQVNAYLLVSPQWLSALYLAAALLGLATWRSPAGYRITATASLYLVLFAFVGQPFNQYWGALLAPLLCFGAARCFGGMKKAQSACWIYTAAPTSAST